ncbi:MAG: hypothetical protein JW727_01260 [Candidatus Aenigmarchaeota archaeon]|nr:hypothetical protein [Candidatus Aenigmarchaeota archaeon]
MKHRKGVAYSVVAIIALVGVLGVLGALSYQSSMGSGLAESSSQKIDQDRATEKLEITKSMVLQDLRFSTLNGVMDITKNGGTTNPDTYWCCNNVAQPVTPNEFKAAIGTNSLQYMTAYVEALNKQPVLAEKGISVSDPECVGVTLPELSGCNHLNCNYFGSGLPDELIEVTDPVRTNYNGALNVNDIGPIRSTHFYNVLSKEFEKNNPIRIMSASMAGNCPEDELTKLKIAYDDLCEDLKKKLDPDNPEYVECKITELSSPHTDCIRKKQEEMCMSPLLLQGGDPHSINIYLADHKFIPLGGEDGKPMEWNIKMTFTLDEPECAPVDTP